VVFFRGRQPEQSIWRRFRTGADGFSFVQEGDYYAAHVVANAERVVDLFHLLSEQLPPAVDVAIVDKRAELTWKGESVALPDVRDAIARLKVPLATYGGIELSVYTSDDQLTLNPYLELFIYARTDRWLYILQGKNLREERLVRTKSWKLRRQAFPPAAEISTAVAAAAERLGLQPA
jgi:hypothetical protein